VVYFVHTLGTVVGGDSKISARVRILGSNTIGTVKDNGCPVIEDDGVIGCGARVLGRIRIGARAQIGANAVVLHDVPADALAAGVPAVTRPPRASASCTTKDRAGPEAVPVTRAPPCARVWD
jgi:serine O-acetyltransferase